MTARGESSAIGRKAYEVPQRTFHGREHTDGYQWLDDVTTDRARSFLRSQDARAITYIEPWQELIEEISAEIVSRQVEDDVTVPVRHGPWWYYTRLRKGSQYKVYCRVPDDCQDALSILQSLEPGPRYDEEVMLDLNKLAQEHDHFALGAFSVSPGGTHLAWSADVTGREKFTIRIRGLRTCSDLADKLNNSFYGVAWTADGDALYYVTVDESWRPHQVWRHVVGTTQAQDELVFTETDEHFGVTVHLSRDQRFVVIDSTSKLSNEVWLVDAADRCAGPRLVRSREQGVMYSVEPQLTSTGGRLLVLHNHDHPDFELSTASIDVPAPWQPLVPPADGARLLEVQAFSSFFVLRYRHEGCTGLRTFVSDVEVPTPDLADELHTIQLGTNPDPASTSVRLTYGSLTTPDTIYDLDTADGSLRLLKRKTVRTPPRAQAYDPADYIQRRLWAIAEDGTRIPISLVVHHEYAQHPDTPFMLFGYGSYEHCVDPTFNIPRLSLLDRGFGFAIAHVRGGGEMGRRWYEGGRLLCKRKSFTDFIACARYLSATGWTSPGLIVARGGSAGGLLVGAAVNMSPKSFGGVIAQVPFVDALTTMLDPQRPLTVSEWEEWGDPLHDAEAYDYIKSYSPVDNVTPQTYPPIVAVASLNDARVSVSEAAKWIAKLQDVARGGPFVLRVDMAAGHGGRSRPLRLLA